MKPLIKAAWDSCGAAEAGEVLKAAFGEDTARPEACAALAAQVTLLKGEGGVEKVLAEAKLSEGEEGGGMCCGARGAVPEAKCSVQ